MRFLTRFRRLARGGAAVLDPHEADVRTVAPEDPSTEQRAPREQEPAEPHEPEHISPDAKELEREHRGY